MMRTLMKLLGCLLLLVLTISVQAEGDEAFPAKPQIVISWSHSAPDTAYFRRHAEWLERRPFDGVALEIDPRDATWLGKEYWEQQMEWARSKDLEYLALMYERPREKGSLNWAGGASLTFSGITGPWNPNCMYTEETLAPALADIKAAQTDRLHFNLIITGIMAPTTDWFNDEDWEQRCHNFAMIARLARQSGCQGILFDDEQYGEGCVFNYNELRKREAIQEKNFKEVRKMAQQRGRQFGKAIFAEFPDMVFWTLHGYGTIAHLIEMGLPEYARDLKAGFYDGILEVSSDDFIFVDGGELGYGLNTREQFEFGRKMIKEEPIRMGLTQVPDLHRKKVRCGFGLWPDYYGKIDTENLEGSYFSPGRFQRALYWALEISDGYVWLYGERFTWWVEGPDDRAAVDIYQGRRGLPLEYWDALEAGRSSPGRDTSPAPGRPTGLPHYGRNYAIDGEKLNKLLERTEKVMELPVDGWTFKLDDWGNSHDDPKTFDKPITVGPTWTEQGYTGPDTVGLYRLEFTLPVELKDRKLHFYLPDVDGSVWMASMSAPRPQEMAWRYIGLEPESNRKPFVLTHPEFVSYFFEPGKPAVVVIKVQGINGPGGILAPIQVLAE